MKHFAGAFFSAGLASALLGCAPPPHPVAASTSAIARPAITPAPDPSIIQTGPSITGTASYYQTGPGLRRTASGQPLNNNALTAASPTLPLGTKVKVKPAHGGRAIIVVVNDRMPPTHHRVLDLSVAAAKQLGVQQHGVAKVTVTPVAVASTP
jgi:rare lipoprotein A